MKRLILTAVAALALTVSANAQIGIVAGLTSASTSIDEAYNDIAVAKTANKYHFGLVYNLDLPFGLSVQPGILYNVKGQSLNDNITAFGQSADITINTSTGNGFRNCGTICFRRAIFRLRGNHRNCFIF